MGLHGSRVVKRLGDNKTETIKSPKSESSSGDSILPELLSPAHVRRDQFAPTLTGSIESSVASHMHSVDGETGDVSRLRRRRTKPLASKVWGRLPTIIGRGVHS